MNWKYDIFISYRRQDSGDKAEHLKDLLEPEFKGRISFDRENLTGLFDVLLVNRIDKCKDFLLIVGKGSLIFKEKDFTQEQVDLYEYLGTCTQDEFEKRIIELGANAHLDFVRIEIARALHRKGLNIIPIVPESTDDFNFSKLSLPPDIVGLKRYEAVFYSDSPNALFKDVVSKIKPHLISKPDMPLKKVVIAILLFLLCMAIAMGSYYWVEKQKKQKKKEMMIETALDGKYLNWSDNITIGQVQVICEILDNMVEVKGGSFWMGASQNSDGIYDDDVDIELETPQQLEKIETFWMSKYEVSISQWYCIMGGEYEEGNARLPIVNVSYDDCVAFVEKLADFTNLSFALPSEAEWEYAARGGINPDSTKYAGSDIPEKVAWYVKNSQGKPYICDASNSPMYSNALDLYDMSGNVSEWCDTDFAPYNPQGIIVDKDAKVIRGGNYESEAYGITVYHREPMNAHDRAETVGLRIIIRN